MTAPARNRTIGVATRALQRAALIVIVKRCGNQQRHTASGMHGW